MATHGESRDFNSVREFISAADKALYSAKLRGRNQSIVFDTVEPAKIAKM